MKFKRAASRFVHSAIVYLHHGLGVGGHLVWPHTNGTAKVSLIRIAAARGVRRALNGETLVGLDRETVEAALERAGADEGFFTADDEEGSGQIAVPRLGLSVWFADHVAESVGWGTLFDDDDNVLWPTT